MDFDICCYNESHVQLLIFSNTLKQERHLKSMHKCFQCSFYTMMEIDMSLHINKVHAEQTKCFVCRVYKLEQTAEDLCMIRYDKGLLTPHGFHDRKFCKQLNTGQRGRNSEQGRNKNNFFIEKWILEKITELIKK